MSVARIFLRHSLSLESEMLPEGTDLKEILSSIDGDIMWVSMPRHANVVIVHKNTDALLPEEIEELLERGGIYVEYATSKGVEWESSNDKRFYGSYFELKKRLSLLSASADPHSLLSILRSATIPWRYEFFLEVSLRLLSLTHENIEKIEEIMGTENKRGSYETWCGVTPAEQPFFYSLRQKISQLCRREGQNLLQGDEQFAGLYREIYDMLFQLAEPERRSYIERFDSGNESKSYPYS